MVEFIKSTGKILNSLNFNNLKSDLMPIINLKKFSIHECKGALASLLLSLESLNTDQPIVVVPSDGLVPKSEFQAFIQAMSQKNVDCGVLVFESFNNEYSFVRTNTNGEVIEIAEKKIISNLATAGIFYFKNRQLIIDCGQWAIVNNLSYNGEFYIAPSLNYFVTSGLKIHTYTIQEDSYLRFATSKNAKENWSKVEVS